MCGIVGRVGQDAGVLDRIKRMSDELTHRGPDDAGYFVAPGIELGMRCLAVIDIAHGKQPLMVGNGSIQVVFNGEIYNYRELRVLLEGHGDRFTTDAQSNPDPHA